VIAAGYRDTVPSGLGEFLRSRRGEVRPDDVGLPAGRARRVPGLRREEVALLAGVSVDYYVRLEQGRERSPSAQVLDALAEALQRVKIFVEVWADLSVSLPSWGVGLRHCA
jgi:transcriptional regulator with XRE-family HTH domain